MTIESHRRDEAWMHYVATADEHRGATLLRRPGHTKARCGVGLPLEDWWDLNREPLVQPYDHIERVLGKAEADHDAHKMEVDRGVMAAIRWALGCLTVAPLTRRATVALHGRPTWVEIAGEIDYSEDLIEREAPEWEEWDQHFVVGVEATLMWLLGERTEDPV